jgi:hypothetical protein
VHRGGVDDDGKERLGRGWRCVVTLMSSAFRVRQGFPF